jgi:RecA/RadA recombinase
MAAKKKIEKDEASEGTSSENILGSFLKDKKEDHYNFFKEINYKVSTGSLLLDVETGGGLCPGLHRFMGVSEGGKTSEALEVMGNFLEDIENSRGVLFKAEGRLPVEMRDRCGVPLVFSSEEWTDGTCFVYESNIFDSVFDLMRTLIMNNPDEKRFCFIIDCIDALVTKEDRDRPIGEAQKVAGGALLSSVFMKKVALAMSKFGHMCIVISQRRAEIKLDMYAKSDRQIGLSATGGNALVHNANFILEFEDRHGKDLILEKPNEKPDRVKNKIIGHFAKVVIKKSVNEKSCVKVAYPICYGRQGGSVWKEYEVMDLMEAWGMFEKSGAWINITLPKGMDEELAKKDISYEKKHQGADKFRKYLEENSAFTSFLFESFSKTLSR